MQCKKCQHKWINKGQKGYCYMFEKKPKICEKWRFNDNEINLSYFISILNLLSHK